MTGNASSEELLFHGLWFRGEADISHAAVIVVQADGHARGGAE